VDDALEDHTPFRILGSKLDKIGCDCKTDDLRNGIVCNTCKLLLQVDSYMMDLFKNVATERGFSGI
jgi:hypothetical protein